MHFIPEKATETVCLGTYFAATAIITYLLFCEQVRSEQKLWSGQ